MAAVQRVEDPEVPKLLEKIYKIPAPAAPREDLVAAFLTGVEGLNKPPNVTPAEIVRLNTTIAPAAAPERLGVLAKDTQGFPNGRRLTDDVVDIELQALAGAIRTGTLVEALAKGDGVDENDLPFGTSFPYVALPHSGSGASASGFGGGEATDEKSSPTPSAKAEGDEQDSDAGAERASNEEGLNTGALVAGVAVALLVGLGLGALLGRRRGSRSSA
jgi:hypothetical protein